MNRMQIFILRPSIYWLCMAGSEPDSCRGGELPRPVWWCSCLGGLYNHLPFGPRVEVWAPRLHIPCPVHGRDGYIAIISILHREQGQGTDIVFNCMFNHSLFEPHFLRILDNLPELHDYNQLLFVIVFLCSIMLQTISSMPFVIPLKLFRKPWRLLAVQFTSALEFNRKSALFELFEWS